MKTQEAIKRLDEMQRQVVHGSTIFKDIADVIREAKEIIGYMGTIGAQRKDVLARAKAWLDEGP